MFRLLLVGLWASGVTLGATYGGVYYRQHKSAPAASDEHGGHGAKPTVHKAKPLTVPIISDGVLKGYVAAELSFVTTDEAKNAADPESFFLDEAFRLIYGETKIDFTSIQKTDLDALTGRITENVNRRLGKPIVKETLVRNLSFVSRDDMPK